MSKMVEAIIGVAIGAGAMYVKSKVDGEKTQDLEQKVEHAQQEIEHLRARKVEAEETEAKLRKEIASLKSASRGQDDEVFDLEDALEDEKRKTQKLTAELTDTQRALRDAQLALEAAQMEIARLKAE